MPTTNKIVIICSDEKTVKDWKYELMDIEPNLIVEVYPNDTQRENTQFVLAFRPPENVFENYPNLKVIASMAAGINHITNNQIIPENVQITKVNDAMHHSDMADFVLLLALSHLRQLPIYFQQQKQKTWQIHDYQRPQETTVGIMGFGAIGKAVGQLLLKNNFKVSGWSRSEKHSDQIETFHGEDQKTDFLKTADILVCTLPLTPQTEDILNTEVFNNLPKGAYVINVGRGNQLIEADLLTALDNEQLSGAALDVFRKEPLPQNHPFWKHEKIVITPHTAGDVNPKSAVLKILSNFKAMKNSEALVDVVDVGRGY